MNIQKTHTEVRFWTDKLATGAVPSLTKEGIDLALNNSIESFIKIKYRPVKELVFRKEGFEAIQKRIDDLSVLVTTKQVAVADTTDNKVIDLDNDLTPEKYQFYLKSSIQIGDGSGDFRGIQIIKHDNANIIAQDPFNRSSARRPKALFTGRKLFIIKPITGTGFHTQAKITYLKRFTEVSLDDDIGIELADHTHREIVQIAVQQLLETIESPRVQTNKEKILMSE